MQGDITQYYLTEGEENSLNDRIQIIYNPNLLNSQVTE